MASKKVLTHTFNGTKYDVHFVPECEGSCGSPREKNRRPDLDIICKPRTKNELRVIIHEALHAESWAKSEKVIDRVSVELSDFLWRLGYRKKRT